MVVEVDEGAVQAHFTTPDVEFAGVIHEHGGHYALLYLDAGPNLRDTEGMESAASTAAPGSGNCGVDFEVVGLGEQAGLVLSDEILATASGSKTPVSVLVKHGPKFNLVWLKAGEGGPKLVNTMEILLSSSS
jgi:hypothetical protein